MAAKYESIVFYETVFLDIQQIDDVLTRDKFCMTYLNYALNGIEPDEGVFKGLEKVLWNNLKRTADSIQEKRDVQAEKGRMGGAPRGNDNAKKQPKSSQNNLNQAETSQNKLNKPNGKCEMVNVKCEMLNGKSEVENLKCENDNVFVCASAPHTPEEKPEKSDKQKPFSKPTHEQVAEYCRERKNSVNPGRFIDFYESKGWFVGKNKMKDWMAAVRTWENSQGQSPPNFSKPLAVSQRTAYLDLPEAL